MHITIKYFGALAEQTGKAEEAMVLQHPQDVPHFKADIIRKYGLRDASSIRIAINEELNDTGKIRDGDEIAFLPPFSGG